MNFKFGWILRMAWRESRNQKKRLFLFISSIIIGIAALVAINSFNANLQHAVNEEAKTLLGADLVLRSNRPFNANVKSFIDSLQHERAAETGFSSMLYFPKSGDSRLARIRAIDGGFPFYGTIETAPAEVYQNYADSKNILVDESMMIQFGAEVGDSVALGNTTFKIAGAIRRVPGQSAAGSTIAPTVFMPMHYLEETGLIQFGSLAIYRAYFKLPDAFPLETFLKENQEFFSSNGVRTRTVEQRKQRIGRVTQNLNAFFNLISLFALILGSIGVSSSITVYIRQKMNSVAVLRCLGGKSAQVFNIYLFQTLIFGLIGTALGVALGVLIQFTIPSIARAILPVNVELFIAWPAVLEGFTGGFMVTFLFTFLPLISIRKVSPLLTLRSSFEEATPARDPLKIIVVILIAFIFIAFIQFQFGNWFETFIFAGAFIISIGLFILAAKTLVRILRKAIPRRWSYPLRQGLANLHRPQNQTTLLLLALGIGTFLIATLYLTQNALLNQVAFSGSGDRPNLVLFDIQTDQKESVKEKFAEFNLPLLQEASIVTMRLKSVNDTSVFEMAKDSSGRYERWALRGELRSTYRDSLSDSEEVQSGDFYKTSEDSVFISIADGYQDALDLKLGDKLEFDIQGVPLTTYIGSIREVNWQRIQPNFLVVFPTGILEQAPQFHVMVTRVNSAAESAAFQRAVVQTFPGISLVDLGLIIQTLEKVLDEFAFVIRFMAFFTILTGIIVLIGSLNLSRLQRIKEAVLLRTIGAAKSTVNRIMLIEYAFIGGLAALLGIGLATLFTWILTLVIFETVFAIPLLGLAVIFILVTALTIMIGLGGNSRMLSHSPMQVLRAEG